MQGPRIQADVTTDAGQEHRPGDASLLPRVGQSGRDGLVLLAKQLQVNGLIHGAREVQLLPVGSSSVLGGRDHVADIVPCRGGMISAWGISLFYI
jgi:hypothetical protein